MGTTTTLDEVVGILTDGYPREVTKCNVLRLLSSWPFQRPPFRVLCETPFQVDGQNCLVPDVTDPVLPGFSIPTSAIFEGV
jgi:hypothetical protein